MSNFCNLCYLLRIQSCDDQPIDDAIKADARHQLSLVEGSDLTVDEFIGNKSSECNKVEPNTGRQVNFRLIHQQFINYCKQLFRNYPGDRVQCGICGKKLKMRNKKNRLIPSRTINHACVHLGKRVFACVHCDSKFMGSRGILSHLKNEHNLDSHPGNYIDSSASYEQEILEMLKRCFGNTGSKTAISGATTGMWSRHLSNSSPLVNFCRRLLKPNKDCKVPCAICGEVLTLPRRWNDITNFISHAYVHLQKPLFQCGQCHLQFVTKGAVRRHLIKNHVLSCRKENYIDMSGNYEKDTMDMLERCFGQQTLVKSEPSDQLKLKPRTQLQLKDPLSNACRRLFANLPLDARLRCSLCGTERKLYRQRSQGPSIETIYIVSHALCHLGKPMFKCRMCDRSTLSRRTMQCHLLKCHKVAASKANYVDDSPKYQEEIIAMLEKCFDKTNMDDQIPSASKQRIGFRSSCPLTNFCRGLLKPDKDGKISCATCGHILVLHGLGRYNNGSRSFIDHAYVHLGKPLFKCGQCDLQFCTKFAIKQHLRKAHVLNFCKENYIDLSCHYQKDMMDMLERCFGQDNLVKSEPSDQPTRRLRSQLQLKDPLSNACRKLFANLPLDARVRCSICGNEKKLYKHSPIPYIAAIRFVSHALSHLAKPIFKCRVCDRSTLTRLAMRQHLFKCHKTASSKVNYVDDSAKYQQEIIAMLEKCFDQSSTSF